MSQKCISFLKNQYNRMPDQNVWQWAEVNVDFSKAPQYDTPLKAPYNADFISLWKEVAEGVTDPAVREIWVWKNSRAGASESCLLNPLRYTVACDPQQTLYITGDELSARRFMDKRIKPGFKCATVTAKKFRRAVHNSKYDISFADMDLVVTWPKNRMAFKQSGYSLVLADELSTWPEFSADMMRKRTDTYRNSHIIGISSSDPQQKRLCQDDPIIVEYKKGDQRKRFMKDPKTGNLFKFEMGDAGSKYGLKWSKKAKREGDDTWDLEAVAKSAHYVTPDGTIIREKNRLKVIATGIWMATNTDAPAGIRSYHCNSFYMPFKSGEFGHIACAFLTAKRQGTEALKVFVYEYLAEEWYENKTDAPDDELYNRCSTYAKGQLVSQVEEYSDIYVGKPTATIVTVDVQKAHQWYVVREWIEGGDSGLVDYGYAVEWQDIEDVANNYNAVRVLVDVGYAQRAMEVYEYCLKFQAWPTRGYGDLKIPFRKVLRDPFEGKVGQGKNNICQYDFDTDVFKMLLMDLIRGESEKQWHIYKHIERDYIRQVASEQRIAGKWTRKPGHSQNHLWDCEVLQLLAATILGMFRNEFFTK